MNKTSLTWKSYEDLVKNIYEQLGQAAGVKILGYGSSCKQMGKSGVEHQIDVLTSHSDGIHEYLTDIECKFWDQKINKDIVMKVHEIVDDCNFSKGIIVSKLGFTPDGEKYAEHVGVGLVELREMTEEDWKGRIRRIIVNIEAMWPELDNVGVMVSETPDGEPLQSGNYSGNPAFMEIVSPSGEVVTFKALIEQTFFQELAAIKSQEPFNKVYKYETGTKLNYTEAGKTLFLRAISLTGHIESLTEQEVIEGEEEVLYYMRCIFEGRVILLGKDGKMLKQTDIDES